MSTSTPMRYSRSRKRSEGTSSNRTLTEYFQPSNKADKKKAVSKAVQVNTGICALDEINIDANSKNDWHLVAEQKRMELKIALAENERLSKIKMALLEESLYYKLKLEEAKIFLEVFEDVVQDTTDDKEHNENKVADLN